ncbi:TetR/AcrR family transcriptional regulator [Pantoea sp. BAV 3049]|uniref:TetR/AcrR family transcriptional regulator n=1 Tax=Pantoea sp. BAV 3049 TaxID=2654188 RepID=UPI00131E7E81|nr:TetR/AcrR family transcriptional regulator [Pantoea sp. BAV 3049]
MPETATHKERTRQRILDEAAAIMRVVGTEGIGVAALMKRAGLTHGGFYAHFKSRDDLVANVVDRMFIETRASLQSQISDGSEAEKLSLFIDIYLSDEARKAPEHSCPMPSLASEACRLPEVARARFNQGIQTMQGIVATSLQALGHKDPQALASSVQAEMIGAMALARAMTDEAQARQALQASRSQLKRRLGLDRETAHG